MINVLLNIFVYIDYTILSLCRCEGLADIIWQLRQQVRQLEGLKAKLMSDPQNKDCNLQELLASVTELLSNLVTG